MRPLRSTRATSADLLGELDDDARWAAHVAKPVDVLVVHKLAYQLAAMCSQLCEGLLDVVDGEEDVADARGVGRDRRVIALVCGRAVFGQLELAAVASRGPQYHDVRLHALEPIDAVDRTAFD